jgi:Protein of unknown function (DUF3224)
MACLLATHHKEVEVKRTMRKPRAFLSLLALVGAVVATIAATAGAAPPMSASGTIANTSATFNSVRQADGNLIVDLSATAAYTGTFTGTSTLHGILVIHADGSANFHDTETFTGTVNGVSGTVTFNLTGHNDPDLVVYETRTVTGSAGGLAGLHGVLHEVGTVVLPNGPATTYSGRITFPGP